MDKACTIGFSFISGKGLSDNITLSAGVNRNFPEDVWDQIKDYPVVKNLLQLGALRVDEDQELTNDGAPLDDAPVDSIATLPIAQAHTLIENSFDIDQLKRWDAKEERIRVKNAIARRIKAITEGEA